MEGERLEIATTPCPDCKQDRARGDASQIVYCGLCGREWHLGDADYPAAFYDWPPVVPEDNQDEVDRAIAAEEVRYMTDVDDPRP